MTSDNMTKADFVASLIFIAFGGLVLAGAMGMPTFAEQGRNPYSAPGIVPGVLGIVLMFLGALMLVRSVARGGHRLGLNPAVLARFVGNEAAGRVVITMALCIGYVLVLLVQVIPYTITTFVFVASFVWVFEWDFNKPVGRQKKTLVFLLILAAATMASVSVVFRYLFLVRLP